MPSSNPARVRANRRRYYERHKESIKAKNLARYHANPRPFLKRQKAWRRRNREHVLEYDRAYRLKRKMEELLPLAEEMRAGRKIVTHAKRPYTGKLRPGGF